MKKVINLIFLLLMVAFSVQAQPPGRGRLSAEERAQRQEALNQLFEDIGLTADQKSAIGAINEKYRAKRRELFQSGERGPGMREEMVFLREKETKEIKKVMNKDQFKAYRKFMQDQRPKGGPGQGPKPGGFQ